MKLAKALKVKNRLVGEINRLQHLIRRENVKATRIIGDKTIVQARNVDVRKTMDELDAKIEDLLNLKTSISKANIGIYEKIARMAEHKSMMSFWNTLCFAADEQATANEDGQVTSVVKFDDVVKREEADAALKGLQVAIEILQDEIDEYNATTEVNF